MVKLLGKTIRQWHGDSLAKGKISDGNLNPGTSKIAHSLLKNYHIVAHHTQSFESTNVTYWLLKKHIVPKFKSKMRGSNRVRLKYNKNGAVNK